MLTAAELLVRLTVSSRSWAFCSGSSRSPAVALRRTGVELHIGEGTEDWATSRSSEIPAEH